MSHHIALAWVEGLADRPYGRHQMVLRQRLSGDALLVLAHLGLLVAFLFALKSVGVLEVAQTVSDETDHYLRSLAAEAIFRGHFNELSSLYEQGTWPPFYPLVIGLLNLLFGLTLFADRVLNVVFASTGLCLLGLVLPTNKRWYALPITAIIYIFDHQIFQIRPENFALLILGLIVFVIGRSGAFGESEKEPSSSSYIVLGVLVGILPLTHAVFLFVPIYFAWLAVKAPIARWPFLIALFITAGPYLLILNLIEARPALFSTSSEEALVRNNNPYWDDRSSYGENWARTFPLLLDRVRSQIDQGDVVRYTRPKLVPASRYEQWLDYENKRRIFGQVARQTIVGRPWGYFERIPGRLWNATSPDLCVEGDGSPYMCKTAPPAVVRSAWGLMVIAGCVAFVLLIALEWRRVVRAFSVLGLSLALLMPMILVTALWRQMLLLPIILIFGCLSRLGPRLALIKRQAPSDSVVSNG